MWSRLRKGSLVPSPDPASRKDAPAVEVDERRLETTTKSKWQRRTPVIACGAGLFADGYNNYAIGPATTILSLIYPDEYANSPVTKANGGGGNLLNAITFLGEVVGIAVFAYTADHYSRKWSLVISTGILFVFAALSAGSYGAGGSTYGLLAALACYRLLLGIGIGGEYPAGSVGCAEGTGELESGKRNRWFIWFTNLQIDFGFVVGAIVATVVVLATGPDHLHTAWRVILGIGIIPPLSLIYMRWKMEEPEAFKREKMPSTPWILVIRYYWFRLMIVSAIWFIYDFSAFAFGIYTSTITKNLLGADAPLWRSFAWAILINAFYLPGAMAGSFVADWIGPKMTLVIFVFLQAIVGFIMAGVYGYLYQPQYIAAFCVVYGIFLSLGELGPGDNIGLIASKTCATAVRGRYYGFAAAMGKIGAFVGTYVFQVIQNDGGSDPIKRGQYPFWVAASMAVIAGVLALLFIPHIGQDTIDEEDIKFRAYLESNGYDVRALGVVDGHKPSGSAHEGSSDQDQDKTDPKPYAA